MVSGEPTTDTNRPDQHLERKARPPAWRAPAVTFGPSVLVLLYAIVGTLSAIVGALARPGSRRRRLLLRTPLVGGALLPWVYLLIVRPWHLSWGVTEEEARRPLPYDDLVPRPVAQITHAITVHAPADEVWRWLVQLGQDRGGMYSYDWLENLADLDIHSVEEIIPELQNLKVGDLVRLAPERMGAEAGLRVAVLEPARTLVLHQPVDLDTGRPLDHDDPNLGRYYGWNWVFVLDEVDPETTRLIVRSRVDGRPRTPYTPQSSERVDGSATRTICPAAAATPSKEDRRNNRVWIRRDHRNERRSTLPAVVEYAWRKLAICGATRDFRRAVRARGPLLTRSRPRRALH